MMIKTLYKLVANIDAQDIGFSPLISNTARLQYIPYDVESSRDNVYSLIHAHNATDSDLASCLLYKELFFGLKRISKHLKASDLSIDAVKRLPIFDIDPNHVAVNYDKCDHYYQIFKQAIVGTSLLVYGITDVQQGMFSFAQFCTAVIAEATH